MTGGGRRLGRHIALALARENYVVVVNYFTSRQGAEETVREVRALGSDALAVRADLKDVKAIKKMVQVIINKYKKINVLVNNASVFTEGTFGTLKESLWDETLDTNLKGMFFCSQAVGNVMMELGSGKIINIASLGGLQAWTKHIPYSVSKAGVIMVTRCLAKALAPQVTVNAIAPGTIIMEVREKDEEHYVRGDTILMKRYGRPSDITDLVVYLASTNTYITGQVIPVDGGESIRT